MGHLEEDLPWAGGVGGHAALEHAPAAGLGGDAAGDDALAVGRLDERLHVSGAGRHLQPRCGAAARRRGAARQTTGTTHARTHAYVLECYLVLDVRTGQRVVGVALQLDLLVDAARRHGGAGEGVGALHHGELVAGRRAAQAGLDVAVRGPAHEAAVELAVLDDAAVVQRLHRIAKALQICGMHASSFEHYRNISIFLTVHINAVNFAFC